MSLTRLCSPRTSPSAHHDPSGCLAWISVDNERVSLLDGFTAASYTPPTILFAASQLPTRVRNQLVATKRCTLSAVTTREPIESLEKAQQRPDSLFTDLGLQPSTRTFDDYPSAVASSPVHMYCQLETFQELGPNEYLVVLTVETFDIQPQILSEPNEVMKQRPGVLAKIDAHLWQPRVSLHSRFTTLASLQSMPRPKQQPDGTWTSTQFAPIPDTEPRIDSSSSYQWSWREHGGTSPLGYNATTALIMPRPIGWISTYRDDQPHLAPYSFFTDVASGDQPMVAFSGFRKQDGKKDAQLNAETTGAFCWNFVTYDLTVPMNLSAAEVDRTVSEFALASLASEPAQHVRAPVVTASPIQYECEYVRTIDVGSFSIVVGKVVSVSVSDEVLTDGCVDPSKARPITRLGYMDEYGIVDV